MTTTDARTEDFLRKNQIVFGSRDLQAKHDADKLQQHVWMLWSYVRRNCKSLDSERTCAEIQKLIGYAQNDMCIQMNQAKFKLGDLKLELALCKNELKAARSQITRLTNEAERITAKKA